MPEIQLLALAPADALAFCMVALLSFALGIIVTILVVMARSESNSPEVDTDLFQEDEEESPQLETRGDQPAETPRELWEQDPDWWKA